MQENRSRFPIQGFYAWCNRPESARTQRDAALQVKIRSAYVQSRETYGSPRVHEELKRAGEAVSAKRIARIMRENRILARHARQYRASPGTREFFTSIPNRQLKVLADAPDRVWVGDVTYLRVPSGVTWRW